MLQGRFPYEWVLLREVHMRAVARGCSQMMENPLVWKPPHTLKKELKISSFSFLHSLLLVFLNFPDLSLSSLCLEFSCSIPSKALFTGTWECSGNIEGISPPHNSLGIFCWGRSLKIQREIKREVFMSWMGFLNIDYAFSFFFCIWKHLHVCGRSFLQMKGPFTYRRCFHLWNILLSNKPWCALFRGRPTIPASLLEILGLLPWGYCPWAMTCSACECGAFLIDIQNRYESLFVGTQNEIQLA